VKVIKYFRRSYILIIGVLMEVLLKECPVVIEFPVAWGEMDALRHVNNIVYFRYFESARIAYFEKLDIWNFMNSTGIGPILAHTNCRFKIPLSYPDTVSIGARVSKVEDDRFEMDYYVVSHKYKKIAAEGSGTIVSFDYKENKKVTLPIELKQRILKLEDSITK
jgi:acyl-CoA thioester hydrolase